MLNKTDLAGAVSEGIISAEQAKQLEQFAKRNQPAVESMAIYDPEMRDEPFRLLRGFRDIFIALGVLFLAVGATTFYYFTLNGDQQLTDFACLTTNSPLDLATKAGGALILTLIGIVLAEIITRKLRLPLASLILSLAFALWVGMFGMFGMFAVLTVFGIVLTEGAVQTPLFFLSGFVGISLFYWRYRLPFIMLIIGGTIVGFIGGLIASLAPDFAEDKLRFVIGGLGLVVFLVAMSFDIKDRLRVTRFSECGFWLHLLAAPMIIHSALAISDFDTINPLLIFSLFILLTLIALMIDRRAILVSTLIYLSGAFVQILQTFNLEDSFLFAVSLLAIGLIVVLLGVGWTPLRRAFVAPLPESLKNILPPIAPNVSNHVKEHAA